ncbi:MAG: cation transporter [Myxococcales bacterium]|nr:cation transporter [Myxococcales bacterium]
MNQRDRSVIRVLVVVLLLNLGVAATKFLIGLHTGALALLADALHSVLDASSNVVGIVGITLAVRPPDSEHPYGHRRFETVAALFIGILIAAGLLEIGQGAWDAFHSTTTPEVSWWQIGVVLGTVFINLVISQTESRQGKLLRSSILTADAAHTLSDALAALVVVLSMVGSKYHIAHADVLGALFVMLLIGRVAWSILWTNLGVLVDHAQLDPERVGKVAQSVPGVHLVHKIRTRGTAQHIHMDLHIHLDSMLPLHEAHRKTHQVQDAIRQAFPEVQDVVIHTEPANSH